MQSTHRHTQPHSSQRSYLYIFICFNVHQAIQTSSIHILTCNNTCVFCGPFLYAIFISLCLFFVSHNVRACVPVCLMHGALIKLFNYRSNIIVIYLDFHLDLHMIFFSVLRLHSNCCYAIPYRNEKRTLYTRIAKHTIMICFGKY